jgi:hypothetical protein
MLSPCYSIPHKKVKSDNLNVPDEEVYSSSQESDDLSDPKSDTLASETFDNHSCQVAGSDDDNSSSGEIYYNPDTLLRIPVSTTYCYTSKNHEKFFDDDDTSDVPGAVVPDYHIGHKLKTALADATIKEKVLRDVIYAELKHGHNVKFPDSISDSDMDTGCYTEVELSSLLYQLLTNSQQPKGDLEQEMNLIQGVPMEIQSKPDLAVFRDNTFVFGVVKNQKNYDIENALHQCNLYLYSLLYFFRFRMGRRVESVFGFVIYGCGCDGLNKYHCIELVKLSAPAQLGGPILSQKHTLIHKLHDMKGIQLLIDFLKRGKTLELYETTQNDLDATFRIRSLLTLPSNLWNDPCLIKNGSIANVFHGTPCDILRIMDVFESKHRRNGGANCVRDYLTSLPSNPEVQGSKFYLKVSHNHPYFSDMARWIICELNSGPECYRDLYCVEPYSDTFLNLFLMNDCATESISSALAKIDFSQLCNMFREFWEDIMVLCSKIFHGDVLPHNMVITKDKKLMLIDWDESMMAKDTPMRYLVNVENIQYPYLRYPNFLRKWSNVQMYTQIQMVSSFFTLLDLLTTATTPTTNNNENNSCDVFVLQKVNELREVADRANEYLKRKNDEHPDYFFFVKESNKDIVRAPIEALKEILGV